MSWLVIGTQRALALGIILVGAVSLAGEAGADKAIKMVVGEQRVMAYSGLKSQSIAKTSVAEAKALAGDEFLLFAKTAGETTLTILCEGKPKLEVKLIVSGKGKAEAKMPEVEQSGTLRLEVGSKKIMSFDGLQRLAIGNPKVADAKPQGSDSIELLAKGVGRTNMLVYLKGKPVKSYDIVVSKAAKAD